MDIFKHELVHVVVLLHVGVEGARGLSLKVLGRFTDLG